jgi:ABC-2 type transport system ATP-binding protein
VADGNPREALRHLRADFEEVRQAERDRERSSGSETVATSARILGARVTDAEGNPVEVFDSGSVVGIEIDIEADAPLVNGIVGFSLENSAGHIVFGTNSKLMGVQLATFTGKRTFSFRMDDLRLGEGQISVIAAIAESSGVEVDRKTDAATFGVKTDGTSLGIVYAKPVMTVE